MKRILALAAALSLGGCQAIQNATNYLASPQFTTAATNVKNVAMAFDCGIVISGAQLAQNIVQLVNAGQSAIGTTGKVYAVAQAVCVALQGSSGTTTVSAPVALPAGTKVQSVTVVPAS